MKLAALASLVLEAGIIVGQGGLKIMIGAAVTALLAWALHEPLGQGEAFMADLHARSVTALTTSGLGDVQIAYSDAPYARTARLSGTNGPVERDRAIALVGDVEGSGGAVWRDAAPELKQAVVPAPASAAKAPIPCQRVVDAALAGRVMQFRSGSAWLNPQSRQIITDVAAAVDSCRDYALEIGGLVQGSGKAVAHRAMARERAMRVRDTLIEQGVPAGVVTARSYKVAGGSDDHLISFTVTDGGV